MNEFETLEDAKKYLRDNVSQGVNCPCCGHFTKVYKRKLNATIARALVEMLKTAPGEFVKISDWLRARGVNPADVTKLALWELLEPKEGTRDDGSNRIGYWRITEKGRAFARGQMDVEKYVFEFRNRVINKSNYRVKIQDCFGQKFNYSEIMQNV